MKHVKATLRPGTNDRVGAYYVDEREVNVKLPDGSDDFLSWEFTGGADCIHRTGYWDKMNRTLASDWLKKQPGWDSTKGEYRGDGSKFTHLSLDWEHHFRTATDSAGQLLYPYFVNEVSSSEDEESKEAHEVGLAEFICTANF